MRILETEMRHVDVILTSSDPYVDPITYMYTNPTDLRVKINTLRGLRVLY